MDLPKHLRGPDGVKGSKLFGTHNQQVAINEIQSQGGTYSLDPTGTPGISELHYSITNPRTRVAKPGVKTVYDPSVYNDQTMLDMALRAGAKAFEAYEKNPDKRSFELQENNVNFRVYIDMLENNVPQIGNVHPIR